MKFVRVSVVASVAALCASCDGVSDDALSRLGAEFDPQIAWEEFETTLRFRYAYIEREDFDVDELLSRSRQIAFDSRNADEFRDILQRTSYAFSDPHFIVGPFSDDDYNIVPTSSDIKVAFNADALEVVDVRAGSAADRAGIRPGWIIEKINGEAAMAAALAPFADLMANPTLIQKNYAANLAVNGRRAGERVIEFSAAGERITITLTSPREFAIDVSNAPILETTRRGEFGIIRINNALGDNAMIEEFDRALNALLDTSGLVIDLRNTPSGGNTEVARSIIGHFITDIRSYQVHEIPSFDREFGVPRRFIEQVAPRVPYYANPVVVLGGHWTGSMGEGIVIGMDAATRAHVVASDMGDLLGAVSNYSLNASGAIVDIGDEALFHVDGTPREDFVAATALRNADRDAEGGDPAMTAALEYLQRP